MKLIFFTKYDSLGASSRYRSIQYFNSLEDSNDIVIHRPLFSNIYLELKYKHNNAYLLVLIASYLRRFWFLLKLVFQKVDLVIIEKELFPFSPIFEGGILNFFGIKYVLDYDDAVWHNYDKNKFTKKMLYNKFNNLSKYSKTSISGSHYLLDSQKKFGSKNNVFIPTVIDLNNYKVIRKTSNEQFVIGWIGSPSTSGYIHGLNKVLTDFCNSSNSIVHLIGFDKLKTHNLTFPYKLIQWSSKTEVEEINNFSVGIMPLPDELFMKGKCGFKLIQYMACGIPVIASSIGENKIIVNHEVNGYLAKNNEDWFSGLSKVYNNSDVQIDLGHNGRKQVEEIYCVQKQFKKLRETYQQAIQ